VQDRVLSGGPGDDVDEVYAALCAEYAAELPGLIRALVALVEEAIARPEVIPDARAAAHQLRGTAGSYRFTAVGEAAGQIEDALDGATANLPALAHALAALAHASEPKP
jgi:HPt (histidine-containing phosphotransfer) domain-containing protein